MTRRRPRGLAFALCVVLTSSGVAKAGEGGSAATLRVGDLRCEYLKEPLGIDARSPRLSWTLTATRPGARGLSQSAYQVLVASSEAELLRKQGDALGRRQGRVSDQSIHVPYAGKPLSSTPNAGGRCGPGIRTGRPPTGASPRAGRWVYSNRRTGPAAGSAWTAGRRPRRRCRDVEAGFLGLVPGGHARPRRADRHRVTSAGR